MRHIDWVTVENIYAMRDQSDDFELSFERVTNLEKSDPTSCFSGLF